MLDDKSMRAVAWFQGGQSCCTMHVWGDKLPPDGMIDFHTFCCIWRNWQNVERAIFQAESGISSLFNPEDLVNEIVAGLAEPEEKHVESHAGIMRTSFGLLANRLDEDAVMSYVRITAFRLQLPLAMLAVGTIIGGGLTAYTCSLPIMPPRSVFDTLRTYT